MRPTRYVVFLCGGLLIGISLGLMLAEAKEAPKRLSVEGKFSQLRTALLTYHERNGNFPPTTYQRNSDEPKHSWRVLLLPQFEYADNFAKYDFSQEWNSPANQAALSSMPLFSSYSTQEKKNISNFLAIGDGDVWPSTGSLRSLLVTRGNDSFLLVEFPDSQVNWMSPIY